MIGSRLMQIPDISSNRVQAWVAVISLVVAVFAWQFPKSISKPDELEISMPDELEISKPDEFEYVNSEKNKPSTSSEDGPSKHKNVEDNSHMPESKSLNSYSADSSDELVDVYGSSKNLAVLETEIHVGSNFHKWDIEPEAEVLFDGNRDTTISLNATQLKNAKFTVVFKRPALISDISLYQPKLADIGGYITRLKIRIKPHGDLGWKNWQDISVSSGSEEIFLGVEFPIHISKVEFDPLTNYRSSSYAILGDISIYGKFRE